MKKHALTLAFSLTIVLTARAAENDGMLRGFTPQHASAEIAREEKFKAIPENQRIEEEVKLLSARPHHVGSAYDKKNAEWILALMKSYGWDAQIEEFSALFPTPRLRKLQLLGAKPYIAKLAEPPIAVDPTSYQVAEQLPPYNAYSPDGDVKAPLVYVNYGRVEDYEVLQRMGVSVKGAIVIARYGQVWRGEKPKIAAEHGAIGCILYSDPHDDGFSHGDAYPMGPMRPANGVQRGSVADISLYPGDPQTPGVGATKAAKLLPRESVTTIARIPTLPIFYADATPFLQSLRGPVVPETWRGALPLTYHAGPSAAKVHLAVVSNWQRVPLYDVIARINGTSRPDEWVLRGNHIDAWVNGTGDPISGTGAQLEEARGLGELMHSGWRPQRTIVYCFWDGEEPGMLGSTEWAEAHAKELSQHAVTYINTDGNERGTLHLLGSQSLQHFWSDVARDVTDPETGMSAWQRAHLTEISNSHAEARTREDLNMPLLGGGSDYIGFLDHLGIASVDIAYSGEDETMGQYHSTYDDFYFYTHFEDTDFRYAQLMAQTVGIGVMRLSDADALPFQFTDAARAITNYVGQVKKLDTDARDAVTERNREIAEGVYKALYDPKKKLIAPQIETVPPALNFAELERASSNLLKAAQRCDAAFTAAGGKNYAGLDDALIQSERAFTDEQGLPERPWYKHLINAPGVYTGYGVKTLPGVREAIEQEKWALAQVEIGRLTGVLERETAIFDGISDAFNAQK